MTDRRDLRRFQILRLSMIAAGLVLVARIVHVQVFQHERFEEIARGQWSQERSLPAERGNLYDRHGRPLALSVTKWQIGVSLGRVDDPETLATMLAEVLDRPRSDILRRIRRTDAKHVVLARDVVLDGGRIARLKREGQQAVTTEASCSRIYPTDGVGASLVGFHRADPERDVATGLEFGLDRYLAGRPGHARRIKTADPNHQMGDVVIREAVHGQSLVLTVDSDLQAICEDRLRERVQATGAAGGSVLVLDPNNGDVLAAASWPLMRTRAGRHADPAVWINRNFTDQFEPGSVFKIFTTAALLRHGAIDTATVFNCDKLPGDGIWVDNDRKHKYGNQPLLAAFAMSSNVYFAKAVGNLSAREFYRDLQDFGFGQRTGLPYPAQPDGILNPPAAWSGRSKQTIAIGQEVAVTVLQLGLAVCSVANGGQLYAPRLIREIRNARGEVVEQVQPVPLRRVMAPPLSDLLRGAMGRVVAEGTGVSAAQDWLAVGGKTGTAQKRREGDTGYTPGAYMATFAGMAPLDDPRLVVVTVLDEPDGIYHYAAQSAAPLFADIIGDVRRNTDWLTDVPGASTAFFVRGEEGAETVVPDVLLLAGGTAARRLAEVGLVAAGPAEDGLVVQQVPAAGTRCRPGQTVTLSVAGRGGDAPGVVCPDFSGLSNRQVQNLAARLGIPVQVRGVGYAVAQDLPPGRAHSGRPVTVRMKPSWN